MLKDLNENTKQNRPDKQFIHQVRIILKDWDIKVMSYVMVIVVMIAMIAATVAWFLYFKVVAVSNMGITTADCEVLKVEVKQGTTKSGGTEETNFVEVKEGEENTVLVDLDMPVFDNVETYKITVGEAGSNGSQNGGAGSGNATEATKTVSKMAPGVYGSLTIRITSLSKEINRYRITPETLFTYVEGTATTVSEGEEASNTIVDEKDRILRDLAKGHILFFENRMEIPADNNKITIDSNEKDISEYTHNSKYVFYNQIESGSYTEGDLTWDTEKKEGNSSVVTLYWYWPYEYTNLSKEIREDIKINETTGSIDINTFINDERLKYFDKDKMKDIVNNSISWNETQLYDYADTRIGTYVKSMQLHLEVKGYHETQQTQSGG